MPVTSVHERSSVIFSSFPQPAGEHRDTGYAPIACPACGGHTLKRVRRRKVDRFMSAFVASRRFVCRDKRCHWLGNLTRNAVRSKPVTVARRHALLWSAVMLALLAGAEFWRG